MNIFSIQNKKKAIRFAVFAMFLVLFTQGYLRVFKLDNAIKGLGITNDDPLLSFGVVVVYLMGLIVLGAFARTLAFKIVPDAAQAKAPKYKASFRDWMIAICCSIPVVAYGAFLAFADLTVNQTIGFAILAFLLCTLVIVGIRGYLIYKAVVDKG